MKKLVKYAAATLTALMMAGSMVSCSDTDAEKDKGATPVIRYARVCDPQKSDSLVVAASLGAKIAFVGDNLGDVQQVWFNDQRALLNPTMVTSHVIIVDVPNTIPAKATNEVRFITSTGIETPYPFQVTIPAPRVDKMDCEWAPAGSQATFEGAYFVNDENSPLSIVFPGGKEAKIASYTQETVTFVVPEDAPEGPIKVNTLYGQCSTGFNYKDTRGMLFDFEPDGITGLGLEGCGQGWHSPAYVSDDNSLSGIYIRLGDGSATLSAKDPWDDGHFAFEYWPGSWNTPTDYPDRQGTRLTDIVDFSDFQKMSIKFEMRIPESSPWQAGALQLIFGGVDKISLGNAGTDIFGNTVAGCNNTYFQQSIGRGIYRPWTTTQAFHTSGKWITVTMPLSECVYDINGGKAIIPLTKNDFSSLVLFVVKGGLEGVDCTPIICIDNIRAVRN